MHWANSGSRGATWDHQKCAILLTWNCTIVPAVCVQLYNCFLTSAERAATKKDAVLSPTDDDCLANDDGQIGNIVSL